MPHFKSFSFRISFLISLSAAQKKKKKKTLEMVAAYEESRKKRLEENKKRMEALNLQKLSQSLHKSTPPKPRTLNKHKELVLVRRSGRVANLPTPLYKQVLVDRVSIPRRSYKRHRDYSNRVYASDEDREEALEKAQKLESDLESQYPTFIKSMLQSHVSGGFWLGLPVDFCRRNLPKRDETIDLIDEDGNEYQIVYLAQRKGLSGGWRGFAVAHDLADGDALVFQLINRSAFKVYIVRVNGLAEEGEQHE